MVIIPPRVPGEGRGLFRLKRPVASDSSPIGSVQTRRAADEAEANEAAVMGPTAQASSSGPSEGRALFRSKRPVASDSSLIGSVQKAFSAAHENEPLAPSQSPIEF